MDLEIHPDGLSIYRKDTHTAQFVHFNSYTKFNHKIAWIKSLVTRARKLCSPERLGEEIKNIKRFASYNGFSSWIVKSTIQKCNRSKTEDENDITPSIYISFPYIGKESEQIVRRSKKKLFRILKEKVKINVLFKSTKVSFFTSNKDKIPLLSNSMVVYQYSCPGCSEKYIGKTESTLFNRTKQHAWIQKDSAIYRHFNKCEGFLHIKGLLQCNSDIKVDDKDLQINMVQSNTKIISRAENWQTLAFKESLKIKEKNPSLNHGIKAAKDLCLF